MKVFGFFHRKRVERRSKEDAVEFLERLKRRSDVEVSLICSCSYCEKEFDADAYEVLSTCPTCKLGKLNIAVRLTKHRGFVIIVNLAGKQSRCKEVVRFD